MRVKEESEKAGLKFNIKITKIMASSPITSRQRDGGAGMETVTDFPFVGSKITADSDCSHEIKRHLLLGRKAMTNLDGLLKRRTPFCWPRSIYIVKAVFSPVVMNGCERWTIKKAECQRIDAFELWCWKRLVWVRWTARSSNKSMLKEINPEYSLEGLTLKPKLQYFGHWWEKPTHWKRPWCWERLKAEGREGRRGWDGEIVSPSQWIWIWASPGDTGGQRSLARYSPWSHKGLDTTRWLTTTKQWIEEVSIKEGVNTLCSARVDRVVLWSAASQHMLIGECVLHFSGSLCLEANWCSWPSGKDMSQMKLGQDKAEV